METSKRLIPYSVYLPEEIHDALREYASNRQASSLVRDAITSMLKGGTQFNSGYNQALKDMEKHLKKHKVANSISWEGTTVAEDLIADIQLMEKS